MAGFYDLTECIFDLVVMFVFFVGLIVAFSYRCLGLSFDLHELTMSAVPLMTNKIICGEKKQNCVLFVLCVLILVQGERCVLL
jgi:hypothetical protein